MNPQGIALTRIICDKQDHCHCEYNLSTTGKCRRKQSKLALFVNIVSDICNVYITEHISSSTIK